MENIKDKSSVGWFWLNLTDDLIGDLPPEKILKIYELAQQAKEKYEHEMCVFADEYASYILDQSKLGIKGAMVSMCAWTFFKNRRNEQL
jgi:hypothetical protein